MTRNSAPPPTPVTVEIEDVTPPAAFEHLADALAALWGSLRTLPLGATQHDAYQYFLTRPNAVQRVTEHLDRDGELVLSFRMEGRLHGVSIRPTKG
ncbi:hypothetical protein OG689_25390 [Kitasatospora sp. NBC_00240]|uniref:hypothetical protein n=1 Tax=Kitasatospora sp. NBC_00240 TaxID=2903567 RepID=UPI0022564DED|nr:hypothetical protein [Kitasatospora sp. NBC_00240]MCX5212580.1 hypothetical protein [Kitasatospora sp. NBC_00240]